MPRYFYSKLHHALCMALDHEFAYGDANGKLYVQINFYLNECSYSVTEDPFPVSRWYIHPEWEHMLAPRLGDFIFLPVPDFPSLNEYRQFNSRDKMTWDAGCWPENYRILERDGKPFLWPQSD